MDIEIKEVFDKVMETETDADWRRHVNNLRCFTQEDVHFARFEDAITNVSGIMGALLVQSAYAPPNKAKVLEECIAQLSELLCKLELRGGFEAGPAEA
jgi:hypothetical protein